MPEGILSVAESEVYGNCEVKEMVEGRDAFGDHIYTRLAREEGLALVCVSGFPLVLEPIYGECPHIPFEVWPGSPTKGFSVLMRQSGPTVSISEGLPGYLGCSSFASTATSGCLSVCRREAAWRSTPIAKKEGLLHGAL